MTVAQPAGATLVVTAPISVVPRQPCVRPAVSTRPLRHLRWTLAATLVVGVGALAPLATLRTLAGTDGATLTAPPGYLALAPWLALLDAVTLRGSRELVAIAITLVVLVALHTARGRRRAGCPCGIGWWARHALLGVGAIGTLATLLMIACIVPRPARRLVVHDEALVRLDAHAHTAGSWDARRGFDVATRRAWTAAAGFDVAYVTDHRSTRGAAEGLRTNPVRAGDGPVLLPGLELVWRGTHVNLLGLPPADSLVGVANALDSLGWFGLIARRDDAPLMLLTIPAKAPALAAGVPGVEAIELHDGSPKGLDARQRLDTLYTRLAREGGWTGLAGSDHHGWGDAAGAWSLVRVRGWRDMTPADLDVALRRAIRAGRVSTVERTLVSRTLGPVAVALTVPRVVAVTVRQLTPAERLAWIAWAACADVLGALATLRLAARWRHAWQRRAVRRVLRRRRAFGGTTPRGRPPALPGTARVA